MEADDGGNTALGIAQFEVSESDNLTTIVGLDQAGREVGQLTLVHGRFTLSPFFAEGYDSPDVDGRKLDIAVRGQTFTWEAGSYVPVLHMPAHPPSQWAIAAFVDDPHVKAVLERWRIGFQPFQGVMPGSGEAAYDSGEVYGGGAFNGFYACSGASCDPTYWGTPNTCGGGVSATAVAGINQPAPTYAYYNQKRIVQCCPAGSGGLSYNWFAQKTCSEQTNGYNECGAPNTTDSPCRGCGTYNASYSCSVGWNFSWPWHVEFSFSS